MNVNVHICRVCGKNAEFIFEAEIFSSEVNYFECKNCGYVQTEEPYWLDKAYADAINISDTGIMSRNISNVKIVSITLMMLGKLKCRVVDAAGGYGILVRLLRDFGINAYWKDDYCKNLVARGFEYKEDKASLVTAFEVFEHFVNPAVELDRLLDIAPNILFSTIIIPEPTPRLDSWWYYGIEHGQHIGFFKIKTLRMLAEKRGKFLASDGKSYHLITDKPINTLLWKFMLLFRMFFSPFARIRLRAKTWQDHLYVKGNKHD